MSQPVMWTLKTFKSREKLVAWVAANAARVEWHEVFINNGHAVEYRKVKVI